MGSGIRSTCQCDFGHRTQWLLSVGMWLRYLCRPRRRRDVLELHLSDGNTMQIPRTHSMQICHHTAGLQNDKDHILSLYKKSLEILVELTQQIHCNPYIHSIVRTPLLAPSFWLHLLPSLLSSHKMMINIFHWWQPEIESLHAWTMFLIISSIWSFATLLPHSSYICLLLRHLC